MTKPEEEKLLRCSFCKKSQREVKKLIAGPEVYICEECVDICLDIIAEDALLEQQQNIKSFPTPEEISSMLSENLISQERAKKILSTFIHQHYVRIGMPDKNKAYTLRNNVLLVGPTGTGKTLVANMLTTLLSVPFVSVDLAPLLYTRNADATIIQRLAQAAQSDKQKAQVGIVFIENVQSVLALPEEGSIAQGPSRTQAQSQIMRLLESKSVEVELTQEKKLVKTEIDTRTISFMCEISTGSDNKPEWATSPNQDRTSELIKYLKSIGFLSEFVGRFSSVAQFNDLSQLDLQRILSEPKDSLVRQAQESFELLGVTLKFTDEALNAIAIAAHNLGMGARGLKIVLDQCLADLRYRMPGSTGVKECVVTKEVVEEGNPPLLLSEHYPKLTGPTGPNDGSSADAVQTRKSESPEVRAVPVARKYVFISYSHQDTQWLAELKMMLAPICLKGDIQIWDDLHIKPSDRWRDKIEKALSETMVAVLLVSPSFLASEFVMREELPYFLEVAESQEVKIIWVLLSACLYDETPLNRYQAAHDISIPIDRLNQADRRTVWTQICRTIKDAVNLRKSAVTESAPPV